MRVTTSSRVCADASLTLKLVLPESDSAAARSLWEMWGRQQVVVIAPSLWAHEVTSVIRNRASRGLLAPEDEAEAFLAVHQLPVALMAPEGLHERAWQIARQFNRSSAYDAHYLALAENAGCPFWTADQRLFNAVNRELPWVHWLGDYDPASIRG